MDFISIDFEIANNNFDSACSIGMVFVEGLKIIDQKYFTIKPPVEYYDPKMTEIHNLSDETLNNSPTFEEVWNEIDCYFKKDTLVIAHNAQFDMNVLRSCLITYDIPSPNFSYVCSIPLSNRAIKSKGVSQSLLDRTNYFNIKMDNHHNALSDAKACAELVIACMNKTKVKNIYEYLELFPTVMPKIIHEHKLQQSFYKRPSFQRVKMSEIIIDDSAGNEDHPFYNKSVVFTGTLSLIDRKSAMQSVADLGGVPRSTVSRLTNFVVVGMQDITLVGETGKSGKHRKAEELIEQGHDINIIDEESFLNLLNNA